MIAPRFGNPPKNLNDVSVAEFDALLRENFSCFVHKCFNELNGGSKYRDNYHIEAMVYQLELCRQGRTKRLIINVQPRSLKTLVTSVAWPAFILGHDPTHRILHFTYSIDFALKPARDFRRIVNAPWYRRRFPAMQILRDTDTELETTRGGGRVALSIGGSVTGRGAHTIIIDDPIKAEEANSQALREKVNEYYAETLYSRLDNKMDGVIVLVMQRLHAEDLTGYVLKQPGWELLKLPAIATEEERIPLGDHRVHTRLPGDLLQPALEPRHVLDQIKANMGGMAFQAQYQQSPIPEAGNMVRLEWFRRYDTVPPRTSQNMTTQSWDPAIKGGAMHDYAVCTTWRHDGGRHYLVDVQRQQCEYPELRRLVFNQYHLHNPDALLIEDKVSGSTLIADLRHQYNIQPIAIKPEKDKTTRLSAVSPMIEQGSVYIPRQAPWLSDFLDELLGFPQKRFDDQVDSLSQYLGWFRMRTRSRFEYEFM
jgi:predicted phage terminase large subunit-like protein